MRIVLCYPVEPRHVEQIQAAAPQAEICDAGQEHVATELFRCDLFCGHPKVPIDWDGIVRQGRLKWIQSSAAGSRRGRGKTQEGVGTLIDANPR